MQRQRRRLSVDDQKAVDVLLDHGANAGANSGANSSESGVARHAEAISARRFSAASKLLDLLNELPPIEPPKDLVARTMKLIDLDIASQVGNRAVASAASVRTHIQ